MPADLPSVGRHTLQAPECTCAGPLVWSPVSPCPEHGKPQTRERLELAEATVARLLEERNRYQQALERIVSPGTLTRDRLRDVAREALGQPDAPVSAKVER